MLGAYTGDDAVVYALPRGGVPVALEVAKALDAPLDLVIPRKVGHPASPEYAIAAVTESGEIVRNESEVAALDPDWFERAVAEEREEATRRRERYLAGRKPIPAEGKTAIVVDDGIATGLTMRAAVRAIRKQKPARLIVAIPVAPDEVIEQLTKEVDEVIVAVQPRPFLGAIGAYYRDFEQTADSEVIQALAEARK